MALSPARKMKTNDTRRPRQVFERDALVGGSFAHPLRAQGAGFGAAAPLHLIRRRVDILELDERGQPVSGTPAPGGGGSSTSELPAFAISGSSGTLPFAGLLLR